MWIEIRQCVCSLSGVDVWEHVVLIVITAVVDLCINV